MSVILSHPFIPFQMTGSHRVILLALLPIHSPDILSGQSSVAGEGEVQELHREKIPLDDGAGYRPFGRAGGG